MIHSLDRKTLSFISVNENLTVGNKNYAQITFLIGIHSMQG